MIFIPGNVPSSKNSKIKGPNGIFHSETVQAYLKFLGVRSFSSRSGVECYKTRPNIFAKAIGLEFEALRKPIELGFHFVRDSRRKFDFINAMQIICDLLVAHRFIEDDNCDCLIPSCFQIDGRWYSLNKDYPGVYLKVLNLCRQKPPRSPGRSL